MSAPQKRRANDGSPIPLVKGKFIRQKTPKAKSSVLKFKIRGKEYDLEEEKSAADIKIANTVFKSRARVLAKQPEEFYDCLSLSSGERLERAKKYIDSIALSNSDLNKHDMAEFNAQVSYENHPQNRKRSDFRRLPDSLCAQLFEPFPWSIVLSLNSMSLGPLFERNLFRYRCSLDWSDELFNSLESINSTNFFRKISNSLQKLQCNSRRVAALVPALALMRQLNILEIAVKDSLSPLLFLNMPQYFYRIRSLISENSLFRSYDFINVYQNYFDQYQRLHTLRTTADEFLLQMPKPYLINLRSVSWRLFTEEDMYNLYTMCYDMQSYNQQIESMVVTIGFESFENPWAMFKLLEKLSHLTKLKLYLFDMVPTTSAQYFQRMHQNIAELQSYDQIETFALTFRGFHRELNYYLGQLLRTLPKLKRLYLDLGLFDIGTVRQCEIGHASSTQISYLSLKLHEQPPNRNKYYNYPVFSFDSIATQVQCLALRSLCTLRYLPLCLQFINLEIVILNFREPPTQSIDPSLAQFIHELPKLRIIHLIGYQIELTSDSFLGTLPGLVHRCRSNPQTFYQFRIPLGQYFYSLSSSTSQQQRTLPPIKETLQLLEPLPNNLRIY